MIEKISDKLAWSKRFSITRRLDIEIEFDIFELKVGLGLYSESWLKMIEIVIPTIRIVIWHDKRFRF